MNKYSFLQTLAIEGQGNDVRIDRKRNAGVMLVYMIVALVTLLLLSSLAVDLGRAQLAKTELRRAADAAARYGAQGFANNSVTANAIAVAAQNNVDGSALVLQNNDVTIGKWRNNAFYTSGSGTDAVRVTARRTAARNTAIPLLFAGIAGRSRLDITVQSVATYEQQSSVNITALAKANPWLAGMPNGTTANDYDSAPDCTPQQVTGLTIMEGATLNFSFAGGVSYLPGTSASGPDGNTGFILYNHIYTGFSGGREHGKSNLTAPITSVIGIFLTDANPTTEGSPPADLDFTSDASRDFATLTPELRQPFFIGDGLRADGSTRQSFIVPTGASRLFIGVMDGQQWSDNSGSFTTNVSFPMTITMVR